MGLDIHLYVNPTATMNPNAKTRNQIPDVNNVMVARWYKRWDLYNIFETMYKISDPDNLTLDECNVYHDSTCCLLLNYDDITHIEKQVMTLGTSAPSVKINGHEYINYAYENTNLLEMDFNKLQMVKLNLFMEPNNVAFAYWSY